MIKLVGCSQSPVGKFIPMTRLKHYAKGLMIYVPLFAVIAFLSPMMGMATEHSVGGETFFNSALTTLPADSAESSTSDYIRFYQKYISGVRGHECPMYPSCSHYGMEAFNNNSFPTAFAWTAERLMRCGHDHDYYPLTLSERGFKLLDYPADNPFPDNLLYQRNTYFFAYSDLVRDDSTKMFIKGLINNGHYREAMLEIRRVEFKKGLDLELFINKVVCYRALDEHENALFDFETRIPEEYKSDPELLYHIAAIEYELGNYNRTLERSSVALSHLPQDEEYTRPRFLSLNALAHARQKDWGATEESYREMLPFKNYNQLAETNLGILDQRLPLRHKSPTTAGLLSIVPGAGYAYTGHTQTAISAFLLNGLLGYATYSSIDNGNYGLGILTGIFNLAFYIGNISGAVRSAHRFNDNQWRSVVNSLEFNSNF
jgi:putative component of membrane protein insertase Oxa1/YidC/SpoIIIJ protein YidD